MLPLINARESRAFERSFDPWLSENLLMEHAGFGAARVLEHEVGAALAQTLILGGVGNNGGDAWVLARALRCRGLEPRVWLCGEPGRIRGPAAQALGALKALGCVPSVLSEDAFPRFLDDVRAAKAAVDGCLGVGVSRPVTGLLAEAIRALNAASAPTLALDVPSGVCASTGQVLGCAVVAACTATFAAHKPGLLAEPGRALAGRVVVVGLGVPAPALGSSRVLERRDHGTWLPPRAATAHKRSVGHVAVVGGGAGTEGAAVLAARGAMRAGAGLVTWLRPLPSKWPGLCLESGSAGGAAEEVAGDARPQAGSLAPSWLATLPEVMTTAFSMDTLASGRWDALVLGPGFGRDSAAFSTLSTIALTWPGPAVLDADALAALAQSGLDGLRACAGPRVLTPHEGEAARLLGCTAAEVASDRFSAVRSLSQRAGQVVVLKGPGSLVACPEGRIAACPYGSAVLASGGTGDVLAGMLSALLAQDASPFTAACAAVLWHALASERFGADRGVLASDLADALPLVK